eukprot:scaffold21511_cov133-Isochrysis_galbana.AAC.1
MACRGIGTAALADDAASEAWSSELLLSYSRLYRAVGGAFLSRFALVGDVRRSDIARLFFFGGPGVIFFLEESATR